MSEPTKLEQYRALTLPGRLKDEGRIVAHAADAAIAELEATIREKDAEIERLTADVDRMNDSCIRDLGVTEQRAEAAEVEVERLRGEVTLWKLAAETRGEALDAAVHQPGRLSAQSLPVSSPSVGA